MRSESGAEERPFASYKRSPKEGAARWKPSCGSAASIDRRRSGRQKDHSVEERKALGFKKSNHCCTRSLSCTSLAINCRRQRFEQNWFV